MAIHVAVGGPACGRAGHYHISLRRTHAGRFWDWARTEALARVLFGLALQQERAQGGLIQDPEDRLPRRDAMTTPSDATDRRALLGPDER